MKRTGFWVAIAAALCLVHASSAEAYIGPGAGISVVGTAVAFVASVVFAIVGFVWYPMKRLLTALRNLGGRRDEQQDAFEP